MKSLVLENVAGVIFDSCWLCRDSYLPVRMSVYCLKNGALWCNCVTGLNEHYKWSLHNVYKHLCTQSHTNFGQTLENERHTVFIWSKIQNGFFKSSCNPFVNTKVQTNMNIKDEINCIFAVKLSYTVCVFFFSSPNIALAGDWHTRWEDGRRVVCLDQTQGWSGSYARRD